MWCVNMGYVVGVLAWVTHQSEWGGYYVSVGNVVGVQD